MSASVGTERVDPNLTPLLDVVLQLIMFFMITVNFVSDQVNQNVVLPTSNSTQEIMAKGDVDVLVINVEVFREEEGRDAYGKPIKKIVLDDKGRKTMKIIFTGTQEIKFVDGEEMIALGKSQRALADQALIVRRNEALRLKKQLSDIKDLKMHVVIRADVETHFGLVHPLITQCNSEGFSKVELRVLSKPKK